MATKIWATLRGKRILQNSSNSNTTIPHWLRLSKYLIAQVLNRSTDISMLVNGSSSDESCESTGFVNWHPSAVVNGGQNVGNGHACVVLNQCIEVPVLTTQQIWQNAKIRCLVDGGANYWRNFVQMNCEKVQMKQPEFVTGDFDSITNETKTFFSNVATKYIHTPNQDETDFTKALRTLQPYMKEQKLNDVIVLQENTGRLDHIMANINTLYKLQSNILNVHLLSSTCLTWLLLPGKHTITIPRELVTDQRWCALMPVGSAAHNVTTTGLKWNLTHSPLKFGYMVSTSNTYSLTEVSVETESPLVWSMAVG